MNAYEQFFSVKGGGEVRGGDGRKGRIQIFMYNPSRFKKEKDFPAGSIITDIFKCYPPTYQEYQDNKEKVKDKIAVMMVKFKEFLLNKGNLSDFLDRAFFDRRVDFLVIYDDEIFHIFDKVEVWSVLIENLEIDNNVSNQKVVLKYKYLCGEIEMRTTDDGKYPTIFMPVNKRVFFDLLKEKIPTMKKLYPYLWLYGNAIKQYRYDKKKP